MFPQNSLSYHKSSWIIFENFVLGHSFLYRFSIKSLLDGPKIIMKRLTECHKLYRELPIFQVSISSSGGPNVHPPSSSLSRRCTGAWRSWRCVARSPWSCSPPSSTSTTSSSLTWSSRGAGTRCPSLAASKHSGYKKTIVIIIQLFISAYSLLHS